mmetsp:Transcript_2668/g.5306  ORF Transcript_2668/g.5306 Transcript_2668/m.5306 type:complete len:246 (+) Transcript_2668:215-952(+)
MGLEALLGQRPDTEPGDLSHLELRVLLVELPRVPVRGVLQHPADEGRGRLAPPEPELPPVDPLGLPRELQLVHEVGAVGVGAGLDVREDGHVGVQPVDALNLLLQRLLDQAPLQPDVPEVVPLAVVRRVERLVCAQAAADARRQRLAPPEALGIHTEDVKAPSELRIAEQLPHALTEQRQVVLVDCCYLQDLSFPSLRWRPGGHDLWRPADSLLQEGVSCSCRRAVLVRPANQQGLRVWPREGRH